MKNNTVKIKAKDSAKPIEVYESDINLYADEYIQSLDNPDSIYQSSVFTGMVKYIYMHLFKPDKVQMYNCNSVLNTQDIESIDRIWNRYTLLCYKYRKRPTLLNFSLLVGISMDTINTWIRGEYRNASALHSETAKKWKSECEGALIDGAIDNNSVGCIFALKACYGYAETAPVQTATQDNKPRMSAEQIAERHKGAKMPELPDFDSD